IPIVLSRFVLGNGVRRSCDDGTLFTTGRAGASAAVTDVANPPSRMVFYDHLPCAMQRGQYFCSKPYHLLAFTHGDYFLQGIQHDPRAASDGDGPRYDKLCSSLRGVWWELGRPLGTCGSAHHAIQSDPIVFC